MHSVPHLGIGKQRLDTFWQEDFLFCQPDLRSMNTARLLGRYTHSVWDLIAQVLPMVLEEAQALLHQAIAFDRDAAKFTNL